jgi:hypothetical protein
VTGIAVSKRTAVAAIATMLSLAVAAAASAANLTRRLKAVGTLEVISELSGV